ncbi:MAG: archaeal proteasome endopeptidase complex subunit alpha [Candidatus Aenigmatarchaeota archaeon]
MPELLPEYLGYDRTIAVFSPDGRLFQVEYAKEAGKRGPTALSFKYDKGIILAASKFVDELQVPSSVEKIFKIDDHIGMISTGLLSDARYLSKIARIRAQSYTITYDEKIDVSELARYIGDEMQQFTMFGGLRPFGTWLIIGGIDLTGKKIFEIEPSGTIFEWNAVAIGRQSEAAMKILRQKWKEEMSREDAINLAKDILKKLEKDATIEIAFIEKDVPITKITKE